MQGDEFARSSEHIQAQHGSYMTIDGTVVEVQIAESSMQTFAWRKLAGHGQESVLVAAYTIDFEGTLKLVVFSKRSLGIASLTACSLAEKHQDVHHRVGCPVRSMRKSGIPTHSACRRLPCSLGSTLAHFGRESMVVF